MLLQQKVNFRMTYSWLRSGHVLCHFLSQRQCGCCGAYWKPPRTGKVRVTISITRKPKLQKENKLLFQMNEFISLGLHLCAHSGCCLQIKAVRKGGSRAKQWAHAAIRKESVRPLFLSKPDQTANLCAHISRPCLLQQTWTELHS